MNICDIKPLFCRLEIQGSSEYTADSTIVTGGSTLIGHGVVEARHREGANVVADIDVEGGQRIVDPLGERTKYPSTNSQQ